jgi:hypothetical protein
MVMTKRLIPVTTIVLALILSGCSTTENALKPSFIKGYRLKTEDMKGVQIYLAHKTLRNDPEDNLVFRLSQNLGSNLENKTNEGKGHFEISGKEKEKDIILKPGTPGVIRKVTWWEEGQGPNGVALEVDFGEGVILDFGDDIDTDCLTLYCETSYKIGEELFDLIGSHCLSWYLQASSTFLNKGVEKLKEEKIIKGKTIDQ